MKQKKVEEANKYIEEFEKRFQPSIEIKVFK